MTRFTLDSLYEGGIQKRSSIAKEEIKSRLKYMRIETKGQIYKKDGIT